MKILLDVMISRRIEKLLKDKGFEIIRAPHFASNDFLLKLASEENATILTADKDFISHVPCRYSHVKRIIFVARKHDWKKFEKVLSQNLEKIIKGLTIENVIVLKEKGCKVDIKHGIIIEFE